MIKLFRAVKGENIKFWGNTSRLWSLLLVFLIAIVITALLGSLFHSYVRLPDWIASAIAAELPDTQGIVLSSADLSGSDALPVVSAADLTAVSGSDASASDASVTDIPTGSDDDENSKQALYLARLEQLRLTDSELGTQIALADSDQRHSLVIERQECIREALLITWYLDSHSEPVDSGGWNTAALVMRIMLLPLALLSAAAIGQSIGREYRSGTVRMLYTLPVTRWKLYLAKQIVCGFYTLLLTASAWLGCLLGASIGFGLSDGSQLRPLILGGTVSSISLFAFTLLTALAVFGSLVLLLSMSAFVAALSRSGSICVVAAAIVTLFSMLFGDLLGSMGSALLGVSLPVSLELAAPLFSLPKYAASSWVLPCLSCAAHWLIFTVLGYFPLRRDV